MPSDAAMTDRAEVFASLFLVMQHMTRRADQELADLGITSRQWLLLAILTNTPRGSSPSLSEAAAQYGSSRQNVKQVTLGLQAQGFVRLVPDRTDGRTTRIELTERIQEFDTPRMRHRTEELFDDVFAGLTPGDVHDLLCTLRRWLSALRNSDPGKEGPA